MFQLENISKKYGGREVMWKRFLAVYEKIEDIIAGIEFHHRSFWKWKIYLVEDYVWI